MLRTYFEPENLKALAWVFDEARLILEKRNEASPEALDFAAHRIFALASNGLTPALILANVLNTKVVSVDGECRRTEFY
jgi:hypothetical protein